MGKKIVTFWSNFKEFAFKGNVMNLAVGVIIAGAFGKITTSLVNDIVMPLLSFITGKIDFTNMFIALDGQTYQTLDTAKAQTSVIAYGAFITTIIDFFIMAFFVFVFVKWASYVSNVNKNQDESVSEPSGKECPFCKSNIHEQASRCPHCTSILDE